MITSIKEYREYMDNIEYTPDPIDPSTMGPNDIFVFGSNTEGQHRGGAAKAAVLYYGAIMGQARGLQGNSYAIVTLDYTGEEPITVMEINQEVIEFLKFAKEHPELKFWVTKVGCGISNYSIEDIAPIFKSKRIPNNVILPVEFS